MGSDKASIEIGGTSLLERATGMLSVIFDTVAVAGGQSAPDGSILLTDRIEGGGPLAGLDAAYHLGTGRAVFLMAVDMPFLDEESVLAVVEPPVGENAIRVAVSGGRHQPLCGVYGRGLGALVAEYLEGDDRSMARLFSAVEVVDLVDVGEHAMTNVNTVEDLDEAIRRSGPPRSTR